MHGTAARPLRPACCRATAKAPARANASAKPASPKPTARPAPPRRGSERHLHVVPAKAKGMRVKPRSFPGRDAARSPCEALLRRTGIITNTGAWDGPGSAAHHAVKNGALRCVRGTGASQHREHILRKTL